MLEPRPLCQHNDVFDAVGRRGCCGEMVYAYPDPDLDLVLGMADCAELKQWELGEPAATDALDRPLRACAQLPGDAA